MTTMPFVGAGRLYVGTSDPITGESYCEVTGVVLRDTSSPYSELTECGPVHAVGPAADELDVSMVQDLQAASLLRYARANRGTLQPFVFIPDGTDPTAVGPDNPAYEGTCLVMPFEVGGPTTGIATSSRTFMVQGTTTEVVTPYGP